MKKLLLLLLLLPLTTFATGLTIPAGGTGTTTFQSGWLPMGLNSLRLTEIASTTWGFITGNNTWTGTNTFATVTAPIYQLTGTTGLEQQSTQSWWPFKFLDSILPNTGMYFDVGTGQVQLLYNSVVAWFMNVTTGDMGMAGDQFTLDTLDTGTANIGLNTDSDLLTLTPNLLTVNGTASSTNLVVSNIATATDIVIPAQQISGSTYKSLNDNFNLLQSAGRLTGGNITDNGDGTVSVTAGTGLFRIADDDISQVKHGNWSASSSIAVALDTAVYIGVDYNSGSPIIVTKTSTGDWDLDTNFPLGSVINQAGDLYTLNNSWWVGDGLTNIIERFQAEGFLERDEYVGGLIIGVTGTRNPTLTAGTLWSRLNEYEIDAVNTATGDTFDLFYRDGGTSYTKVADQTQYAVTGNIIDDNSGTLQAIGLNKYANYWVFAEADASNGGRLMFIYPRNEYNTASLAEAEEVPVFPTVWYEHGILVGRITFKQGVDAPVQVASSFSQMFSAALAADHANLSNLDYASAGHTGFAGTGVDNTFTGHNIFSSLFATNASSTNATSTNLQVNSNATTSALFVGPTTNAYGLRIDNLSVSGGAVVVPIINSTYSYLGSSVVGSTIIDNGILLRETVGALGSDDPKINFYDQTLSGENASIRWNTTTDQMSFLYSTQYNFDNPIYTSNNLTAGGNIYADYLYSDKNLILDDDNDGTAYIGIESDTDLLTLKANALILTGISTTTQNTEAFVNITSSRNTTWPTTESTPLGGLRIWSADSNDSGPGFKLTITAENMGTASGGEYGSNIDTVFRTATRTGGEGNLNEFLRVNYSGHILFNDKYLNKDFYIRSQTSGTTFMADASTGFVGIGTSTPRTTAHIENPTATTSLTISSGASGKGGRIILEDIDGLGCTQLYCLNGTCATEIVTCPTGI